jgi:hypothetical protein
MLLHLIRTHHLGHIHILNLNMFTLEVVTTRVEGKHLPFNSSFVKDEEKK